MTGSEHPSGCYRLTAITDKETYTVTTDGTGTASINETSGQYSDDSTIDLEVQKVCSTAITEAVTYSVNGICSVEDSSFVDALDRLSRPSGYNCGGGKPTERSLRLMATVVVG